MSATHPSLPNFEILTNLGAGGMGRVFLARHRGAYGFEKLLAVKVIHPDRHEQENLRAMFLDEARLVAQLDHPAIAQVYDFGEADDALYLVMEFVPGVSISNLLMEERALPPLICASMAAAVCRGLHAAHEAKDVQGRPLNVVHRDVTPSNLVLTFGGQMKILDFGIALMRERSAPVTNVGQIRGKPTYLSPEQFSADPIDRRTDLYSLSIVLHELLTGKKLFTMDAYLRAGIHEAPKNFKELAERVQAPSEVLEADLPSGLDEVVMRGLAVDPNDRFPDARAMAVELEALIERHGCETLESYVERELAGHREAHEERMRTLLAGADLSAPAAEHPGTLEDVSTAPEPEIATEVGPAPAGAAPKPQFPDGPTAEHPPPGLPLHSGLSSLEPATTVVAAAPDARSTRSRMPWLLGAIVLAAVALTAFLLAGEEPQEAEAIAANPSLERTDEPKAERKEMAREETTPKKVETEPRDAPRRARPARRESPVVRTDPVVLSSPEPKHRKAERQRQKRQRQRRRRAPAHRPARSKPKKTVPKDGIITEW